MRLLLLSLLALPLVSSPLRAQDLPAGLSAWWSFEPLSGRFALERVSNAPVPIVSPFAPAHFPEGPVGPALRLDGSTVHLAYDLPAERQPREALTVEAWVALEAYPNANAPIVNQYTFPEAGYFFGMDRLGRWYLAVSSGGAWRTVFAPEPFPKGRWVHVAGTFDSAAGQLRLYLNGLPVASESVPNAPMTVETRQRLTVGRNVHTERMGPFEMGLLNAAVDEVRVWRVARSAADLYGSYQAGTPVPAAGPALAVPEGRFAGDFHRPRWHGLPPKHWTNEPHGLVHHEGYWHIFYQHNPNGPYLHQIHWGHMRSPDLVRWEHLPFALAPEPGWTNVGKWAGDAVVDDDGRISLVYTGVDGRIAGVGVAQGSADSRTFTPLAENPVIPQAPPGTMDFRDPYVWKQGDTWHLIIGSGIAGVGGTVFHYTSPDLRAWTLRGRPFTGTRASSGVFWEMPVLEHLGQDRWIFAVTTVEDRAPARYLYWMGTWDGQTFTPDSAEPRPLDLINHMLSPAIHTEPGGRTVAMGIVPDTRSSESQLEAGWAHLYGMPRVWSLCDGGTRVCQAPAEEVQALRGTFAGFEGVTVGQGTGYLPGIAGRMLELVVELDPGTATEAGVELLRSADGREVTRIGYDAAAGEVVLDLSRSSLNPAVFNRQRRTAAYAPPAGEPVRLHVFLDHSVIEVFVGGREAFSTRAFPSLRDAVGVDLYAVGGTATADVQTWELMEARAVSAAGAPAAEAAGLTLRQSFPNPAAGATTISFRLPEGAHAVLAVYDTLGRQVRTLIDSDLAAGEHTAVWDGRTDGGQPAAAGVYLYRLRAGATAATRRLTLIR
jgi:sucrose-6-phosphate hydrolase SacC (GH32 family)